MPTKPTRLDRLIGWFSPQRGAQRLAARAAIAALAGYDGGTLGYRTEGWRTDSGSADATGEAHRTHLRDRARDLVRNNPHAARAVDVKVAHTIGSGITAEVHNSRLKPYWDRFVETCDFRGDYDLNGILAQIERCRMESGECLVRFVRSGSSVDSIPTQLMVLEPDYIDESRDSYGGSQGQDIRYGIEYDGMNRIIGYWLYPEHPGDRSSFNRVAGRGLVSEFVPASEIIHVFHRLRPGQTRGVTDFAPVIMRLRDLDDFEDAHIVGKKLAACMVGTITTPEGLAGSGVGPQTVESDITKERMQPARWYRLRPGEAVNFNSPPGMDGYEEFKRWTARDVAAGVGIPYELLTNDLSQLNYTSMRGGLIDFRKRIQAHQRLLYLPRVCRRIESKFREDMDRIRPGIGMRSSFEWTPPKFELMDPLKETQAQLEACLAGFESFGEIARQNGWSQTDLLDEIADWFSELDDRGITLKSDPRSKMMSTREPNEPSEPNAADEPEPEEEEAEEAA